jgi:hypothetical protein
MGVRATVSFILVVVDNLNIRWGGLIPRPLKTDAPPDPDGILPPAVSLQSAKARTARGIRNAALRLARDPQSFQPIRIERGKIAQRRRGVQNT